MNGKYHGLGVFTKSDGIKFEGEFSEGKVKDSEALLSNFRSRVLGSSLSRMARADGQSKRVCSNAFWCRPVCLCGVRDLLVSGYMYVYKCLYEGIFQERNCVQRCNQAAVVKSAQEAREEAFKMSRKAAELKA